MNRDTHHPHPRHRHGGFDRGGWEGRGGWDGRGPRRGGRGRYGALRAAVLSLLADGPRHGYQVITDLAERSGGGWRPSPGSVYPLLAQLVDEGMLSAAEADGRRVYALTDEGRTWLDEHRDGVSRALDDAYGSDDVRALHERLHQLVGAVRQAGDAGTTEQREKVAALLAETRRRVYAVLAEEESTEE